MARKLPDDTGSEFWRDIKPIADFQKPGSRQEVYHASGAQMDDERYYMPLSETCFSRPLYINIDENRWCDILMSTTPGLVNRHYHPHPVFAYTLSGRWGYLEYDWIAEAGDYVVETPGGSHTLVSYESDEPMRVQFNVTGPLVWLDEDGNADGIFDVFDYIAAAKAHYEKVGIGADYIDSITHGG